jgi:hypothetical protein
MSLQTEKDWLSIYRIEEKFPLIYKKGKQPSPFCVLILKQESTLEL